MTQELKRRVIYTVLIDRLSEKELWDVMWRWENDFSHKSRYELNQFLAACNDISAIRFNRGDIYREAIRLLMTPEEGKLEADPMLLMVTNKALPTSSVTDLNAQNRKETTIGKSNLITSEVMTHIVQYLLDHVKAESATAVIHYALGNAKKRDLPVSLIRMLEDGQRVLIAPRSEVEIEDAKQLINLIYIGLCELEGPVEVDNILSSCIQELLVQYKTQRAYKKCLQNILDK